MEGWHYKASNGELFGPYDIDTMVAWHSAAYFPKGTMLSQSGYVPFVPFIAEDPPWRPTSPQKSFASRVVELTLPGIKEPKLGFAYIDSSNVRRGPYTMEAMQEMSAKGTFINEQSLVSTVVHDEWISLGDIPPWSSPTSCDIELPAGWTSEPSKSRKGQQTYINIYTRERQAERHYRRDMTPTLTPLTRNP